MNCKIKYAIILIFYLILTNCTSNIFSQDFMPLDVELVLGYWDTDRDSRLYWLFTPDNRFRSLWKGPTDHGIYGNWRLSGNILTLDVIPNEITSYNGEKTMIIEITIVDKDNILFTYKDGTVEKLTRSNNTDLHY